jgi:hypothetical protein
VAIETIDVADALAVAVDGEYNPDLDAFLSAGSAIAATGRVVLTVVVTEANEVDAEGPETHRTFRFLAEEVRS